MNYIIKDEILELKYQPGKGAWTYHLRIPYSSKIELPFVSNPLFYDFYPIKPQISTK
jgi:hypothetical protein